MATSEQVDEARLEAALERIAAARRGREPAAAQPAAAGEVAERLDALIAELRLTLAEQAD